MTVQDHVWQRMLRQDAACKQKHRCHYCRAPMPFKAVTADHKRSRKNGGLTTRENIAAACEPCNRAKGWMTEGAFLALINRDFPSGAPVAILLIWASRRIFKRAERACRRIEGMVT